MKKVAILVLSMLLILCGCQIKPSSQRQYPKSTTGIVNEHPIVIVDTAKEAGTAYVIGFCANGDIKSLDEYMGDGEDVYNSLDRDDMPAQISFLDLSEKLALVDNKGASVEIQPLTVSYEKRVIDEIFEMAIVFDPLLVNDKTLYVGTYSKIDIFPEEMSYQNDAIQVDLDVDGDVDSIQWVFYPADPVYGDNQDYSISVSRNGENYSLTEKGYLPLREEDLAIFIADLNQDGESEILVYAKGMSRFGEITVYQFTNDQYTIALQYIVDPEP